MRYLKENATEAIIGIALGVTFLAICWAMPHAFHWLRGVLQ